MTRVALSQEKLAFLNKKFSESKQENTDYSDREKTRFFSIQKNGRYIFRILPLTATEDFFGKYIASHFIKFDGEEKGVFVPCVEGYNVQDAICPICETLRELSTIGIDTKNFWKLKSKTEVAMKVLMISTPDETELPKNKMSILKVPLSVFRAIIDIYSDPEGVDVLDPVCGCAFSVQRKDGDKKWTVAVMDSSKPQCGLLGGSEENKNAILAASASASLDKIFKLPTDEKMMTIKELALKIKNRLLAAKGMVDSAVSEISKQAQFVEKPISEKRIPIVNPMKQSIYQASENFSIDDDIPFDLDSSEMGAEDDKNTVLPEQKVSKNVASENFKAPNIDYDNLTEAQKKIIEEYRDGCPYPCFGRHDMCNIFERKECLLDPWSNNCAMCIKKLTGIDNVIQ